MRTLKSCRQMNVSEMVRRYADECEMADALLIASKYEDQYKKILAGDSDDDMAINFTLAAVASPLSAMELAAASRLLAVELAAAEPLLAVVEVLPARQSSAVPLNYRCLYFPLYDLTGPRPVQHYVPHPYGYPPYHGFP